MQHVVCSLKRSFRPWALLGAPIQSYHASRSLNLCNPGPGLAALHLSRHARHLHIKAVKTGSLNAPGQPRKSIQRPPHTSQRPQDIHIPLQNHPRPPQPAPPDPIPHAIRHLPISPPTTPRRSTPKSTKVPVPPLQFRFLPPPLPPINPATPIFTRNAALDMKHPMNLLAWRRVEAWKQNAFNWNVTVSLGVSKKAVVRNWLRRRVQAAMREGLKARGRGLNGEVLAGSRYGKGGETDGAIEEGEEGRKRGGAGERDLQGALLIVGDKSLITDGMETVRAKIERVLDQVMLKQGVVKGNKTHGLVTRKAKKGLSALRR